MQSPNYVPAWHKESYDRLLNQSLPELLARRLPLAGYHVDLTDGKTYLVQVVISNSNGDIEAAYQVPMLDERGVANIDSELLIVIPHVLGDDLASAEVRCVGERLYDAISAELGDAPEHLPWNVELLKAWLPLDQWFVDFFKHNAQKLDQTNWLATQRHLRAVALPNREKLITPSHVGRVCPFETPEGPNIGRILRIAIGAEICDGGIHIVDDSPAASLGMTANMIPLLEHDDPNRLLMGANMMGQWILPPDPEPALVQTGFEPNAPDFWCGRNLLTAFISWGGDTIEDGIVISESAAERLGYPHAAEPGDKISNRHGTKGIISRVLPDDEMPHLQDGTPIELVYSFIGVPGRLNFGQIREALWGRIARAEGSPIVAPPFNAPSEEELRERMKDIGLSGNGMEVLRMGENGPKMDGASTIGWVYWGKTAHLARRKLMGGAEAPLAKAREEGLQRQAELEYRALRDSNAFETAQEIFTTRAARNEGEGITEQVISGRLHQSPPPSPKFGVLQERLAAAGIVADLNGDYVKYKFASPQGETLPLACPVRYPWLWERELTEVGIFDDLPEYALLVKANARLTRMLESNAPVSLVENATVQLQNRVDDYFDALLSPADLRFDARVQFSGRAVIAPGSEFDLDEIGLPEELAWRFYSPHLIHKLGDETAIRNRTTEAAQALDEIMRHSWLLVNRAPSLTPTAILAYHPVRIPGNVIRINPLICPWLNADFDGDQVAVFLPLTTAGQEEAGERLSIRGHLARDPELIRSLVPAKDAIWGLANKSLSPEGCTEIDKLAQISMPYGYLSQTELANAMVELLNISGIDAAVEAIEHLARLGFKAAKKSGASVSPFIGESLHLPPRPKDDDPETWRIYADQITEQIAANNDFSDPDLGVHFLLIKCRKRIPPPRVYTLLGATRGVVSGMDGEPVVISNSHRAGLTPEEMRAIVVGAREGLARVVQQWEQPERYAVTNESERSFNVLARARRAVRPGIVFARAAAIHEIDPLADIDSRLYVGMGPK
jgi:hypothetical protein